MTLSASEKSGDCYERSQLAGMPPIVCAVDKQYVAPLCVMLASLVESHVHEISKLHVVVLHEESLGSNWLHAVRRYAEYLSISLECCAVSLPDAGYPVFGHISRAAYLRLAIPRALPDFQVVLYIDTDVLVLGELWELLKYSLHGAPLAAVRDAEYPILSAGDPLPGWQDLGIPGTREYFNSGVMLINLVECERRKTFELARRFLIEHPGCIRYWDQDALNWAADDCWLRLPYKWNTHAVSPRVEVRDFIHRGKPCRPIAELIAAERRASILHFAGPYKPWKKGYPQSRLRDMYIGYLERVAKCDLQL